MMSVHQRRLALAYMKVDEEYLSHCSCVNPDRNGSVSSSFKIGGHWFFVAHLGDRI